MFDLTGKTAVVTGGGKGIGQSICEKFAKRGAEVFIIEIDEAASRETVDLIAKEGGKAHHLSGNVADQQGIMDAFDHIVNQSGKLDILVNNAGIAHVGNVENTTEEDMQKIYDVNIKGPYNCLKAAITQMKKSGGGSIVNIASVAAIAGISDRFAYSTSKGAILTMTFSIAKDYVKENIRCNAISPGRIHTPFVDGFIAKKYPGKEEKMFEKLAETQPIGRMGKPDEIAYLALYLCSDEASFVTGSNYIIDGGITSINSRP